LREKQMPDYAAQWDSVWNPYCEYAAYQTDLDAVKVIDHIKEAKRPYFERQVWLQEILREIGSKFFPEIDNYRAKCRQLKNAYTLQLATDVQNLNYNLRMNVPAVFLALSKTALGLCTDVARQMQKDQIAGLVQKPAHKTHFTYTTLKLIEIERGLKADADLYGDTYAVAEMLRKIRENP
jgi:hypothetical protein